MGILFHTKCSSTLFSLSLCCLVSRSCGFICLILFTGEKKRNTRIIPHTDTWCDESKKKFFDLTLTLACRQNFYSLSWFMIVKLIHQINPQQFNKDHTYFLFEYLATIFCFWYSMSESWIISCMKVASLVSFKFHLQFAGNFCKRYTATRNEFV